MFRTNLSRNAAVLVLVIGAPVCAHAGSFNAKPGAWEMTATTLTTGMPIPADVLAQMPPEQRAKMEAAMKARASQPTTLTARHCVTQEDLDQNRMLKSDGEDHCTRKVVSKSSSKVEIEQVCPAPRASTAQMLFEIKTPETLSASIDMVQDGAAGKVHVDVTGRWLGASCAGIKDGD